MDTSTTIALIIAPLIAIIIAVSSSKILDKKSLFTFISAFICGLFTVIPMIIALTVAEKYGFNDLKNLRRILFYSFFVIGFFAEFSKFLVLKYYFIPKEILTKPFDGILFSVMIALGFATTSNIYFSLYWGNVENLLLVNYCVPFTNLLLGIIMGFFVGMSKFRKNPVDTLTGLFAAIFFQGFFNFCIASYDYLLLGLVGFGTLVIAVSLSIKSVNTDVDNLI